MSGPADDPARPLIRRLSERLGAVEVRDRRVEPWASVTFAGHRVTLRIAADRAAADRLLLGLPEIDWALPGRIVADIAGMIGAGPGSAALVTIEALLLDDA